MADEAKEAKQPQEAKQEETIAPKEVKAEPEKEEVKKEPPKETPKETPKEAPKEAPKEVPKAPVKEKKEPKEQQVLEKPANCMKCNKHLQRKTWYYRNNGYYCSKRCWKSAEQDKKEAEAKKEEKKA